MTYGLSLMLCGMECAGCDPEHGLPNCKVDVGDDPLIRLESDVAVLGFCSNDCRDRWGTWVEWASTWSHEVIVEQYQEESRLEVGRQKLYERMKRDYQLSVLHISRRRLYD